MNSRLKHTAQALTLVKVRFQGSFTPYSDYQLLGSPVFLIGSGDR
jgi:hypothetical protein